MGQLIIEFCVGHLCLSLLFMLYLCLILSFVLVILFFFVVEEGGVC